MSPRFQLNQPVRSDPALTLGQERLRDRHAEPVLRTIRTESANAPSDIKPLLEMIARMLFAPDLDVSFLWKLCQVKRPADVRGPFYDAVGRMPHEYICFHRCTVAKVLLEKTQLGPWKIGQAVGWKGATKLRRPFKRIYGESPVKYRKIYDAKTAGNVRAAPDLLTEDAPVVASGLSTEPLDQAAGAFIATLEQRVYVQACVLAEDAHRLGSARIAVDEVFLDALCSDCRQSFTSDDGRYARMYMRQAMTFVPRSLLWFDSSCDACYRLFWEAITRARFARLSNAFHAWWMSEVVVDDDTVDRGLFVRLLCESEKLAYRNPRRRLELCRRAVEIGRLLGEPELVTLARIYEGNALRALSRFFDAREVFNTVEPGACPWLQAAYLRDRGTLEADAQELETAVGFLRQAFDLYQGLDPHDAGLVGLSLADAIKWQSHFAEALTTFEDCVPSIDIRRWPDVQDHIMIYRGLHQTAVGDCDSALGTLSAEPRDVTLQPFFKGAVGELAIVKGNYAEAIASLSSSVKSFLAIEKYDNALVQSLALAEAQARAGTMAAAIETATSALAYSVAGARIKDAMRALRQLIEYTRSATEFADGVAELGWKLGGALPPPRLRAS